MELSEYITKANELFKEHQETKEVVDDVSAAKALAILNRIKYNSTSDYYLGCACINLLNTYVKQGSNKRIMGYGFKSSAFNMIKALNKIPDKDIYVKDVYDTTYSMNVLYFIFCNTVTFSFHGIDPDKNIDQLMKMEVNKEITFDNIRKQMCALTVFRNALKIPGLTNETTNHKDLMKTVDSIIIQYKEGKYIITRNGLVLK